jgi:hypothetical protein
MLYCVLTGCRLGAAGGCTIAAALRRHRALTRLDLSGNLVLPEGGRALSLALSHSALAHLDLSCNKMGGAAGKVTRHLCNCHLSNCRLCNCRLSNCRVQCLMANCSVAVVSNAVVRPRVACEVELLLAASILQ